MPRRRIPRIARSLRRAKLLGLGLGAGLLWACAPPEPPPQLEPGPLALQPVEWNAKQTAVGRVAGVAELYDDTLVLSDQGAQVFTSGLLLATDATQKSWRTAAVIPAGDLSGEWLVGVHEDGRLFRLRNRSTVEDITDRYGLSGAPVRGVADLGQGRVGFALDQSLALADGTSVTRYPLVLTGLVGGGGRVAGLSDGLVRVTETGSLTSRDYQVPGALAVALDAGNRLVVASERSLYAESDTGTLDKVYTSPDATFRGMVRSGTGVWAVLGDGLVLLSGGALKRSADGVVGGDGPVRLFGSPSGDVWLLRDGALRRFGEETPGGADEAQWKKTVLPIFTRLCSLCHLPNGSAGIDLSTYRTWASRRALMEQRVLVGKPSPMPPAGAGKLTEDERVALQAWVKNQ